MDAEQVTGTPVSLCCACDQPHLLLLLGSIMKGNCCLPLMAMACCARTKQFDIV